MANITVGVGLRVCPACQTTRKGEDIARKGEEIARKGEHTGSPLQSPSCQST